MTPNHRAAVEWVFQNHRTLFDQNLNHTCFRIVQLVLQKINDPDFGHVGKTAGEGQYRPDGWMNFETPGSDGKLYTMTGVSHDAIKYKNGQVIDLLGRGNDSAAPIFNSDGSPMTALPQWSEVPQEFNRPNNPWIKAWPVNGALPVPVPQPPTIPSYEALGGDAYWRAELGVPLQADMKDATAAHGGGPLNDGSVVWLSRPIFRIIEAYANGQTPDRTAIIKSVRNEWRAVLTAQGATGLPPL